MSSNIHTDTIPGKIWDQIDGVGIGRIFINASMILGLMSMASAGSGFISGLGVLCSQARSFLAVSAMALIVMAAAVYAIGQILGAETRARAAVWATSMLTGSVIGIVIYLVVPSILSAMAPGLIGSGSDPCAAAAASPRGP